MKEIICEINKYYGLDITSCHRVEKGIKSKVFILSNEKEKYILRIIKNKNDLDNLIKIDQLNHRKFTAPLCQTLKNNYYIKLESEYYFLQQFIKENNISDHNISVIQSIATSVKNMSVALNSEVFVSKEDEYSIDKLYREVKNNRCAYDLIKKSELHSDIINSISFEKKECSNYVHGDCGIWNMIYNESVYIVDFGELRKGPVYFDHAAAFISYVSSESLIDSELDIMFKAYLNAAKIEDIEAFVSTCLYWMLRGVLAKAILTKLSINSDINKFKKFKEFSVTNLITSFKEKARYE